MRDLLLGAIHEPSHLAPGDPAAFDEILASIAQLQKTIDEAEERRKSYRPFQAVGVRREDDD